MDIKKEFPLLQRKVHGKPLIYLDNAATSQKPKQVLEALQRFYTTSNANVHRGVYKLSEEATIAYEQAHETVAHFINAKPEEIIFTSGTTESINTVAYSFCLDNLQQGDEVVISAMEHHSNLVPWQQLCELKQARLKVIPITHLGTINIEDVKKTITVRTKIVAVTQMSNVLGTINDVKSIAQIAHSKGALLCVDAAQSVPHIPVDVKALDCDFLAFSGHKMLGPTGIGVLYGKEALLNRMRPFKYGGGMIDTVTFEKTTFAKLPEKFEAGTPNIAGAIGLAAAMGFLQCVGVENIHAHELELTKYALQKMRTVKGLQYYGLPQVEKHKRGGVISFNLAGIHAHDVASILDKEGIAVRAGHHCCQPLMKELGVAATVRASFYLYNTKKDVDKFVQALEKVQQVFQ